MAQINRRAVFGKAFVEKADDGLIICRCEEITKGEIRRAVYDGMRTALEVKRYLRCGMGLCQGQTCGKLIRAIIAKELGVIPFDVAAGTARAPVRPVEMEIMGNEIK